MEKNFKQEAYHALSHIKHPRLNVDIVAANCIQQLKFNDGAVHVVIGVAQEDAHHVDALRQNVVSTIQALGKARVHCVITTHQPSHTTSPQPISGIQNIIAIASGKGGVGKSTTAVNLAIALAQMSLRIGILDADVFGPSLPTLLDMHDKPISHDSKMLEPLEKFGLTCMSMGFLLPQKQAAIWRGPMVQSALQQMLRQVNWGELDILIVDLPPGTGDVQLTLSQTAPITGAIFVSTPQDLALIDVQRGISMFQRVHVPILGIIENMSYFSCPSCAHHTPIFGHGGAQQYAEENDLPLLAQIPLHTAICQASDDGTPLSFLPDHQDVYAAYNRVAEKLWNTLCNV